MCQLQGSKEMEIEKNAGSIGFVQGAQRGLSILRYKNYLSVSLLSSIFLSRYCPDCWDDTTAAGYSEAASSLFMIGCHA